MYESCPTGLYYFSYPCNGGVDFVIHVPSACTDLRNHTSGVWINDLANHVPCACTAELTIYCGMDLATHIPGMDFDNQVPGMDLAHHDVPVMVFSHQSKTTTRQQDKCWTCAFLWCLSHYVRLVVAGPGVKDIIGMHRLNICLVVFLWCENTIRPCTGGSVLK